MTTNLERASVIARNVELQSVSLASTNVSTNLDPQEVPEEFMLSVGYRTTYRLPQNHPDNVYIRAGLRVDAAPKDDESGDPYLVLEIEFDLVYELEDAKKYPEDALEYFAELNGPYNAWPYFREFVQNTTTRAGLGGIVLPVFRPPVRELEEEDPEEVEAKEATT